jgi:hypothetical protein
VSGADPIDARPGFSAALARINLLTSFWRARRLCSRIIHKNESQTANSSNLNFV